MGRAGKTLLVVARRFKRSGDMEAGKFRKKEEKTCAPRRRTHSPSAERESEKVAGVAVTPEKLQWRGGSEAFSKRQENDHSDRQTEGRQKGRRRKEEAEGHCQALKENLQQALPSSPPSST